MADAYPVDDTKEENSSTRSDDEIEPVTSYEAQTNGMTEVPSKRVEPPTSDPTDEGIPTDEASEPPVDSVHDNGGAYFDTKDEMRSHSVPESHVYRVHERQAQREHERELERERGGKPIKFTEQRRVPPLVWMIILIVCLVLFVIAIICFYAAPSSRQVHLVTYTIVRDLEYIAAYQDEDDERYQTVVHNTILSFEAALREIGYDRIEMNFKDKKSPLRDDGIGLLLVVDIYITIYETPVRYHSVRSDTIAKIRNTLPANLRITYVGSLNIVEFWIQTSDPPEPELTCADTTTLATDPGSLTRRVRLPLDIPPEVPEVNGETPRAWRIFNSDTDPVDTFPVGTTSVTYRVIYSSLENGGAVASCTFDLTIEDKEPPTIGCPPPNIITLFRFGMTEVQWDDPYVRDNVSHQQKIVVTSTHNSGDMFESGTETLVVFYATDEAGNTASCAFTAPP